MDTKNFISFPEKMLAGSSSSQKLKIFHIEEKKYILLEKKAFLSGTDIVQKIRKCFLEGKKEFAELNLGLASCVFSSQEDEEGVLFLALNADDKAILRELCGSLKFEFEFLLISKSTSYQEGQIVQCDLPIGYDVKNQKAFVSHRRGKKAASIFKLESKMGLYELWSVKTNFVRNDQICIHAFEKGIFILGDEKYANVSNLALSSLKRSFKKKSSQPLSSQKLLYKGACVVFKNIKTPFFEKRVDMPQKFEVLLKTLRKIGS